MQNPRTSSIIALDVGAARIGVAVASLQTRLPRPLKAVRNDDAVIETLNEIFDQHDAVAVVVGLPRGLDGQYTQQTQAVEAFAAELEKHMQLPLHWQDEAVTSAQAEAELQARGKPYDKGDIDALAATYILEDYLADHKHEVAA